MNTNCYMLFDTCSQSFVGSMCLIVNDAVAKRSFRDLMNSDERTFPFKRMARDINLMKIGVFNTQSGVFESHVEFICNLENLKEEVNVSDTK